MTENTPSLAATLDAPAHGLTGLRAGHAAAGIVAPARPAPDGASSVGEARLLQARVALYGGTTSILCAMAFVLMGAGHSVSEFRPGPYSPVLHGLAIATSAVAWLLCRGKPRSVAVVKAIDAGATIMVAVCLGGMAMQFARFTRPDLAVSISLVLLTTTRAILVPSSPRRSVVLSAIAWIPGLCVAWLMFRDVGIVTDTGATRPFVTEAVVETMTWALLGVSLVGVASRVIYGLRREAREAQKLGQYTLLEKLGEGGMGQVFRAQHAMLRRPTAVKLLHPDRVGGVEDLARFEREVQLTAQLSHPNVVTVFDYGRTPDGVFYYAMELLDGANLEEVVELGGPMPPGRVVHVLTQVARALAEAHAVGLIHRDIKPANIILCSRSGAADVAKVVDFGLVKQIGDDPRRMPSEPPPSDVSLQVSRTGTILGTPMYLAPEAVRDPASLDARADLYALGAVGYFLITGTTVFGAGTVMQAVRHHVHTAPELPSTRLRSLHPDRAVPADLEAIVLACLAKAPADRPESAKALVSALAACAASGTWTEDDATAAWAKHGERRGSAAGAAAVGPATAVTVATPAVETSAVVRASERETEARARA